MDSVFVNVDKNLAIARGSAQWGLTPVDLQAVLNACTPEERSKLTVSDHDKVLVFKSRILNGEGIYGLESAETDHVVSAIRQQMPTLLQQEQEHLARQAENERKSSARDGKRRELVQIWESLAREAMNDETKWMNIALYSYLSIDDLLEMEGKADEYPWLFSLVKEHNQSEILCGSEIHNLSALYWEAHKHNDKICLQRKKEEKRVKEESIAAWVEWGMNYGSEDLRYAIENGYPYDQRLEEEFLDSVSPKISGTKIRTDIRYGDFSGLFSVPGAKARKVHKYVTDIVSSASLPPGTTLEVSKILSYCSRPAVAIGICCAHRADDRAWVVYVIEE